MVYFVYVCGNSWLVIYEGGCIVKLLSNIGDVIGNIGDINGDGVDDLLFLVKFYGYGLNIVQDVSLVILVGGKFCMLFDLFEVVVDECSSVNVYILVYWVMV